MPSEEIPREQWEVFCESFSHQHHGWLAKVEAVSGAAPAARGSSGAVAVAVPAAVRDGVFESITADVAGSEDEIVIRLRRDAEEEPPSVISQPVGLRLEHTDEGADQALHIQTQEGREFVLRFPVTMPMEMLDGYLPE